MNTRVEPGLMQRIIAPNGEPVALPCSGLTTSAPINSRLIAAAPEMLEALRDCAVVLSEHIQYDGGEESREAQVWANIAAIIHKATGSQD